MIKFNFLIFFFISDSDYLDATLCRWRSHNKLYVNCNSSEFNSYKWCTLFLMGYIVVTRVFKICLTPTYLEKALKHE